MHTKLAMFLLWPNNDNGSKTSTLFEEYASLPIHFRRTADKKNPWLWVVDEASAGYMQTCLWNVMSIPPWEIFSTPCGKKVVAVVQVCYAELLLLKHFLLFHSRGRWRDGQHLLVASLVGYLTGTSKQSIQLNLRSMLMCAGLGIYFKVTITPFYP